MPREEIGGSAGAAKLAWDKTAKHSVALFIATSTCLQHQPRAVEYLASIRITLYVLSVFLYSFGLSHVLLQPLIPAASKPHCKPRTVDVS